MSISGILAAATTLPATQPGLSGGEDVLTPAYFIYPGLLSAVALAAAAWFGVLRPSSIDGPIRIDRRRPVWPLVLVWGAGTAAWLGVQTVLVFGIIAVRHPDFFTRAGQQAQQAQQAQLEQMLSPADWAMLATVPAIAGFVCLLVGDLIYNRSARSWLGFDLKKMPMGVLKGVGATLIILPWMYLVMVVAQWFYERTGYKHPHEHDLLREMNTASPLAKMGLIIGATIGAPFFEELLFRGHLQTLLRQTFIRLSHRRDLPPTGVFPVGPPNQGPAGPFAAAPYGIHWDAPRPSTGPPEPGTPPVGNLAYSPYPPAGAPPEMPPTVSYAGQGVALSAGDAEVWPRRPYVWQTWLAVFFTSIVFMLIHVQPWMFPPIFCLSICLGYVYERTGNLWANITIHALFNTSSTVLYLLQQGHGQ